MTVFKIIQSVQNKHMICNWLHELRVILLLILAMVLLKYLKYHCTVM